MLELTIHVLDKDTGAHRDLLFAFHFLLAEKSIGSNASTLSLWMTEGTYIYATSL